MATSRIPNAWLSPARQWDSLRHAGYEAFEGSLGRNRWQASFDLRPTPASRKYRVRISFANNTRPDVHVLAPDLFALAGGRPLPHIFIPKQHPASLCLYRGKYGDWTRSMYVCDTIVPWTAEWLLNYELWLATGEWLGGGEHPQGGSAEKFTDRFERRLQTNANR